MRLLRDMVLAGLLAVLPLAATSEEPGAMALALSAADAQDWATARTAATAASWSKPGWSYCGPRTTRSSANSTSKRRTPPSEGDDAGGPRADLDARLDMYA